LRLVAANGSWQITRSWSWSRSWVGVAGS